MKRVSHKALRSVASSRPAGYIDDVLSYAVQRTDTHVVFESADYYMLREKYSGDVDRSVCGPGTELHKLLGKFGIYIKRGCACSSRIVQMNKWGCEGCEENIETIVEWMKEEAAARGLPYLSTLGRMLVRRAIHNARKEAERAKDTT